MRSAYISFVPLRVTITHDSFDARVRSSSVLQRPLLTSVVRCRQGGGAQQQQQDRPRISSKLPPLGIPPEPPRFVLPLARELDILLNHPIAEVIVTGLVVLSAIGFAVETCDLGSEYMNRIPRFVENAIASLFTAEYVLRWYSKNLNVPFLFTRAMLIDLFAILPLIFNVAVPFIDSGVIRILRLIRIFRLQRILSEEWRDFLGDVTQAQLRIANVALTVFSILYVSAGLFFDAEVEANPQILNFFDAYYFSTITLFTVGFGDVVPLTSAGRIVTVLTVLTGAVLVPFQLAEVQSARKLSQQAGMGSMKRDRARSPSVLEDIVPFDFNIECKRCHLRGHQKDARYCRSCAHLLRNRRFD